MPSNTMFIRILNRSTPTSNQQAQNLEKDQVKKLIQNDLKSIDLKISLYIAACAGLPLGDIHPCPPAISSESNRIEIASLLTVNDSIPPPESLLATLKHPEGHVLSTRTYGVLRWLILGLKEPKISYEQPEQYWNILKLGVPSENETGPKPEAIFSLKPRVMSTLEQEWSLKTVDDEMNYAFLPCKVENLHRHIYKGRVSNNLESDSPLVLYTDLRYCVDIAPPSWTWGKSELGVNLKILALVEFVDSNLYVRREETQVTHSEMGTITLRNYRLVDSTYGRIKYLLVYPQEKRHPLMIQTVPAKRNIVQKTMLITWALVICLAYVLPAVKSAEKYELH